MAIYREFRMGGNKGPFGFLGPLLILVLFFTIIYFITKGLFYIFSWLSPVLLLGALILNYRVVTEFIRWVLNMIVKQPLFGLVLLALIVLAYPFTAAYLFFKSLGQSFRPQQPKQTSERPSAFSGWQEKTEDIEYEEVESKTHQTHTGDNKIVS
jgi:predicted membrane protein